MDIRKNPKYIKWLAESERYKTSQVSLLTESKVVQNKRIERARKDYDYFVSTYFPKLARCKSAKFQIDAARYILNHHNSRCVFEWARGHAKSTHIGIFIPLWLKIQKERQFHTMLYVSKSYDSATRLLADLQRELAYNQLFSNDFGNQVKSGSWAEGEFITTDGYYFSAVGRGQSPRGVKNEGYRPDYIIIDDIDDDEAVLNPKRINKYVEWCMTALLGTMDTGRGRFVQVGNRIAQNSILTELAKRPGVYHTIVNILDKNENPSWKEKNTIEDVLKMREYMGERAFQKEYMNNPSSEGDVFKEMNFGKCPGLRKFKTLICYSDPSPSNNTKAKNSTKAIFLLGFLDNVYYVLDGRLDRATNAEFVNWIFDINTTVPEGVQVYNFIENNSLQNPFYEQVIVPEFIEQAKTFGRTINIIPDTRKKPDKFSRIEAGLEPLNRQLRLILNIDKRDNPHFKRLEEQFLGLNPQLSLPVDGPDAIEGGVFKLNEKLRQLEFRPRLGFTNNNNKTLW